MRWCHSRRRHQPTISNRLSLYGTPPNNIHSFVIVPLQRSNIINHIACIHFLVALKETTQIGAEPSYWQERNYYSVITRNLISQATHSLWANPKSIPMSSPGKRDDGAEHGERSAYNSVHYSRFREFCFVCDSICWASSKFAKPSSPRTRHDIVSRANRKVGRNYKHFSGSLHANDEAHI